MALQILKKSNFARVFTICTLIFLWIFYSNIELSYSNSFALIRDKNMIIDSDLHFDEDYKMASIHDDPKMKEIGNGAWLQFHEIINNVDVSITNKVKHNDKQCSKLNQWVKLFGEFYPLCDNEVNIFYEILENNPIPTCSNRFILKLWGCHIHNKMNYELGKDEYDCSQLFTEDELSSNDVKFNKVTVDTEEVQLG